MENNPCQQCLGREVNKPVQQEFNSGLFREFRIFVSGFGKQHPVSYIDIIRQSHRFWSGPFLHQIKQCLMTGISFAEGPSTRRLRFRWQKPDRSEFHFRGRVLRIRR